MNKKEVAQKYLATGHSLFVILDPRQCHLPPWLKDTDILTLQYGMNLPIPIPDLYVNDDGISATLSFSGQQVETFVPWSAVKSMTDDSGLGHVWDHSLFAKRATKNGLRLIQGGKSKTRTPPSGPTAA